VKAIRLETLLKWILLGLALCLALFILGTRFYQGYEAVSREARAQLDALGPVLAASRLPEAMIPLKNMSYWKLAREDDPRGVLISLGGGTNLTLSLDRRLIFDALFEENRSLLVLAMIVLLAAVEIATLLAYSVTRPLRRLAWGFAQLSKGRSVRLPAVTMTARELSLLTAEFNEMAEQIDRWREAQQGLARIDRMAALGVMASSIAHEIRNPLASMTIHLDLLRGEMDESDPRMERIDVFDAELARLGRTIDRFLVFAKGGSHHRERVRAGELIEWCARIVGGSARERGVEVRVSADDGGEGLLCAPDELRQLLLNLALNAIMVMTDGGKLTLRAEKREGRVDFSVEDTGGGVPDSLRERIFDPFFTTRADGAGLGLAISRRIAEDHGGTLELESPVRSRDGIERAGSRFIAKIPEEPGRRTSRRQGEENRGGDGL